MSEDPRCVLCAVVITRWIPKTPWKGEFRAVRKRDGLEATPFVTGISGYTMRYGRYSAPSDYDQHFRDPAYFSTPLDEFSLLVGTARDRNPGYPFHESCWQLLREQFYPHEVPIESLHDMCCSFPIRYTSWLDWGHVYGGLVRTVPKDHYPWEELRISGPITRVPGMPDTSPLNHCEDDPLYIPELDAALTGANDEEPGNYPRVSHVFREHEDCFSNLPVEICDDICVFLATRDVVHLRLASRSFARIFLSQYFWRSRFRPGFDRGHIFEATRPSSESSASVRQHDWRTLYYQTNTNVFPSKGLANRRRIWNSCRELVDILNRKPQTAPEEDWVDSEELIWRSTGGATIPDAPLFRNGLSPCIALYERVVRLPPEIFKILVSTVMFSGKRYVTGLQMVMPGQPNIALGYNFPGQETVLDLTAENGGPGILTGFVAAVGPSGIQALRATLLDGRSSEWAGHAVKTPKTLRLCMDERITHLKGGFDGFKMVSLAVPDKSPQEITAPLSLRKTALWYPDIPPEGQYLHDSFFAGGFVPMYYRPLIRVMFGGPNGSYLKYLTKISVTVSKRGIGGIDFLYEADHASVSCMRACRSTTTEDDAAKITFSIDGPGGEILTGIQVGGDAWPPAVPESSNRVEISRLEGRTNFNRHFTFEPSAIPQVKIPAGPRKPNKTKKVEFEPGTTITGIYVMHDSYAGMIDLCPISEVLQEKEK